MTSWEQGEERRTGQHIVGTSRQLDSQRYAERKMIGTAVHQRKWLYREIV